MAAISKSAAAVARAAALDNSAFGRIVGDRGGDGKSGRGLCCTGGGETSGAAAAAAAVAISVLVAASISA